MNITAKIIGSEDYRNKYFTRLKELDAQRTMFVNFSNQLKEASKKKKKSESKKKKSSDVTVTGATNKNEIRQLRRILMQKITEVITEEDDQKVKSIKINNLQRKVDALDRILSQIERLEREQREIKQHKKKKGATEAVHLTSDDLTVNKSGISGIDVSVSGTPDSAQVSPGAVDLIASFEAAINSRAEAQSVDVQL